MRRCHFLTVLLLYTNPPPEPKASLGCLVGFTSRICRGKATLMSTPVQTPVCSWAFSSRPTDPQLCPPNQPSGMWVVVALPCCVPEWDRRCQWHWNVTFNATKHHGTHCPSLPLKGYLPLIAQNCLKMASSSFK